MFSQNVFVLGEEVFRWRPAFYFSLSGFSFEFQCGVEETELYPDEACVACLNRELVWIPRRVVSDLKRLLVFSGYRRPLAMNHNSSGHQYTAELSKRSSQLCFSRKVAQKLVRHYRVHALTLHAQHSSHIFVQDSDPLAKSCRIQQPCEL